MKNEGRCRAANCDRLARVRGMCQRCYGRLLRADRLGDPPPRQMELARVDWHALTRGACTALPEPCELIRCRYHLAEFRADGTRVNPALREPCALKHANSGGQTLEEIGALFNVSRERIRQIERSGIRRIGRQLAGAGWSESDIVQVLSDRCGRGQADPTLPVRRVGARS